MNEWVKNKTKEVKKKIINNTYEQKNENHMVRLKLMNKKIVRRNSNELKKEREIE